MGKVFNSIASWAIKKRIHQIELFMKHPTEVQNETLLSIVDKTKNTIWGRTYNYCDIKSLRQFQEQVPLSTYEEIFPYIKRMMGGEKNVLWPEDIKWFSKSSGTTNAKSKFIPVSKACLLYTSPSPRDA